MGKHMCLGCPCQDAEQLHHGLILYRDEALSILACTNTRTLLSIRESQRGSRSRKTSLCRYFPASVPWRWRSVPFGAAAASGMNLEDTAGAQALCIASPNDLTTVGCSDLIESVSGVNSQGSTMSILTLNCNSIRNPPQPGCARLPPGIPSIF